MSETIVSNDKLKRLELARDLFFELLQDGPNYPPDVKRELKDDLEACKAKIKEMNSHMLNTNIQIISTEPDQTDKLEIDNSYFETKYKIDFHNGPEGNSGKLLFDKKNSIILSGIENDICLKLFNVLKKTWHTSLPKDIGWVSYNDFRKSVTKWKKDIQQQKDEKPPDVVVEDKTIIDRIYKINKKIRDKLDLDKDLIENGVPFLVDKHYRFRINIGFINIQD